jgi:ribosomal-protein-alanine N-acetyltransferase
MIAPPFPEFPELKSNRIRLRQLVTSDIPGIMEVSYFNRIQAKSPEEAIEMLGKIHERYTQGNSVHWGIEDMALKEIVGTCGYYRGFENESGEIGYIVKEQHRRGGYMSEAVKLVVDFGFNVMKLKKVFAITAQKNLASQGVLRKNGFIAAGIEENGDLRFHLLR